MLANLVWGAGAVSIVVPPWNGVFGKLLRAPQSNGDEVATEETAAS